MPGTYKLSIPGPMLERGFWLYVWRAHYKKSNYLYVGRTGDNSSPYATPPYQRMGQHLGHQKNQNALRKHLERNGVCPEDCDEFELVSHGPLYPQAASMATHIGPRDIVAAQEKALADALRNAGYNVMNTVHCRKQLDEELFHRIICAFSQEFPKLSKISEQSSIRK